MLCCWQHQWHWAVVSLHWQRIKKIDTVKLSFSYSKAPESGDEIGDITVRPAAADLKWTRPSIPI